MPSLTLVASIAAALQAVATPDPPVAQDLEAAEEIVVTRRRPSSTPRLEPVEYWRRLCFDPMRLTDSPSDPGEDGGWLPVAEEILERLNLAGPDARAFDLIDPARGHSLILKIEQMPRSDGLREDRCSIIIIGGTAHDGLADRVSAVLRSPGTERHVGRPDGSEVVPGWRQRLWTAMPSRRSRDWRVLAPRGAARAGGTWLVVTDPAFYDHYTYVMADLRTRTSGPRPVSILTLGHIRREGRGASR